MAIVEDLRQLSQSENELNEYFKFEFELKLNTLNKSAAVEELIDLPQKVNSKSICILYIAKVFLIGYYETKRYHC